MPVSILPPEYTEHKVINLRKGKPHAIWVYLLNCLVFLIAVWSMSQFIPFLSLFEKVDNTFVLSVPRLLLNILMAAFTLLCYAVLQLLLKGLFCKLLGGDTPKFGIKGWYFFVGSRAYLSRRRYILFILLPELTLLLLFTLLCLLLPLHFFWIVYLVESFHLSRFSATLYLTCLVLKQPKHAYFRNMGTLTMVYTNS